MPKKSFFVLRVLPIGLYLLASPFNICSAQNELPPANTSDQVTNSNIGAPIPGSIEPSINDQMSYSAASLPTPINAVNGLPLAAEGLKAIVDNIDTNDISQRTEEKLTQLLNWTSELIKYHYKLSSVFGKQNNWKNAAGSEYTLAKQLQQIRTQLLYQKAQLLIRQNKSTEYLPILVDITASDPQSTLGQAAYKCLKQVGFSTENVPLSAAPKINYKPGNTTRNTAAKPKHTLVATVNNLHK